MLPKWTKKYLIHVEKDLDLRPKKFDPHTYEGTPLTQLTQPTLAHQSHHLPHKSCLLTMDQHCAGNFLVQY